MSIANLIGGNFPININNIITKNIQTPLPTDTLTIATENTNQVVIGGPTTIQVVVDGNGLVVNGRILTDIIDSMVIGGTVFIGPNSAGSIQLSRVGGPPITVPVGVLAEGISRGGAVVAGAFNVADNVANTEVNISHSAAPIKLLGSSLQFPAIVPANAYTISDSLVLKTLDVPFTGALNTILDIGARITYYKLGNFVTLQVKNIFTRAAPTADALNGIDPIRMLGVLDVGYRPTATINSMCGAFRNGVNETGQLNIFANGDITVGSLDSNVFTAGQTCGIMDFSYTFNVLI